MEYLSRRAANLTPYTAGEQPKDKKYVKLNTNENPYPPSPKIRPAVLSALPGLPLYPDPEAQDLCAAIAEAEHVGADCVFCGNGSDEVLSFAFCAFFDGDLPLLFPDITYSFYPVFAEFYGIPVKTVPLDRNFEIDVKGYFQPACGVVFPNPNAPTGICLPPQKIRRLLEYHAGRAVIIDEAYIAFGGESVVGLVGRYPNLLVVRTFSKSHSLAGGRVGYAIGQPPLIRGLLRVKNSFNSYPVDRIAAAAARAAALDTGYYAKIDAKIAETREKFSAELKKRGFQVLPSKANFVFASPAGFSAKTLFLKLREHGILVRYFDKPRTDRFLRITIGTDAMMEKVLKAIDDILG